MSIAWRAYLDFVRLPNLFTAMADVIAGYLLVGGGFHDWPRFVLLAGASSCLYGGGAALNDVCDAQRDSLERPSRPIPSGAVTPRRALMLTVILLSAGIGLALSVSGSAAMVAGLLVAAIYLYNKPLKMTALASPLMGSCRALNLILGMNAGGFLFGARTIVPIAALWLYVTSVTYFARREAAGGTRGRLTVGTLGVGAAAASLVTLSWLVPNVHGSYLGLLVPLILVLAVRGRQATARRDPPAVQLAVMTFVMSIVVLDACAVWAVRGPMIAMAVLWLILPHVLLARVLRVT